MTAICDCQVAWHQDWHHPTQPKEDGMTTMPSITQGPDYAKRVRAAIVEHGTVETPTPMIGNGLIDKAAARKIQKTIQAAGYAAGYAKNWSVKVGTVSITGAPKDAASSTPPAKPALTVVKADPGPTPQEPVQLEADPFGDTVVPVPADLVAATIYREYTRVDKRGDDWVVETNDGAVVSRHKSRAEARYARSTMPSEKD